MEGGIEFRTVPVGARGFGQRRNVLPARGLWVATFAPDGGFRGSRLLFPDSEEVRGPTLGPDDHLYVQTTVPFPRVIKYEMKLLP